VVAFLVGAGVSYLAFGNKATPAAETAATTTAPAATETASPADDSEVVARVNGKAITEKDLDAAATDFQEELARVPEAQRRGQLLNALIDLTLIAQQAEKDGVDKTADFQRRIDLLRTRALRSEFVRTKILPQANDEAVRKRYDEEVAKMDQPEEVKASHILVDTEDEAKAIIEQLKAGGDFAAIAKEKSKDPGSGANGGDLGYFTKGMMVPEFEQAAFALEVGKFTETPVKSQFGYHVIKLDDRRKQEPPKFEAVASQVGQLVMADAYQKVLADLKKDGKVEILKPQTPPADAATTPAPGEPMDSTTPEDVTPPASSDATPPAEAAPATPPAETTPATPPAETTPATP
jgi:peptidyl-prolyl cis-trans isomerase C